MARLPEEAIRCNDQIIVPFQGSVTPLLLPTQSHVQHLESPADDEKRRRPNVMLDDHEPHALRYLHHGCLLVHGEWSSFCSSSEWVSGYFSSDIFRVAIELKSSEIRSEHSERVNFSRKSKESRLTDERIKVPVEMNDKACEPPLTDEVSRNFRDGDA